MTRKCPLCFARLEKEEPAQPWKCWRCYYTTEDKTHQMIWNGKSQEPKHAD